MESLTHSDTPRDRPTSTAASQSREQQSMTPQTEEQVGEGRTIYFTLPVVQQGLATSVSIGEQPITKETGNGRKARCG
jgi:hypothetical protein